MTPKTIPPIFKPLLWGLKWDALDVWDNRDAIILTAINHGELAHLRWIKKTYGNTKIRKVLSRRLETEIYPESRNLARVLYGVSHFRKRR